MVSQGIIHCIRQSKQVSIVVNGLGCTQADYCSVTALNNFQVNGGGKSAAFQALKPTYDAANINAFSPPLTFSLFSPL